MALKIIKKLNRYPGLHTPKRVMEASLIFSLFIHIILFSAFQKVFPFNWEKEELRTYRVELIRPPVEEADTEGIADDRFDHILKPDSIDTDVAQETISLETRDKRYVSYARVIKKEIMRQWAYPPEARENLIEGSLMVLFSLTSDGEMTRTEVTRGSGYEILDREVLRAIRDAAPFPPFPGSITVKRLNIKATFDYRLASQKGPE
jgi:TonB family protein